MIISGPSFPVFPLGYRGLVFFSIFLRLPGSLRDDGWQLDLDSWIFDLSLCHVQGTLEKQRQYDMPQLALQTQTLLFHLVNPRWKRTREKQQQENRTELPFGCFMGGFKQVVYLQSRQKKIPLVGARRAVIFHDSFEFLP